MMASHCWRAARYGNSTRNRRMNRGDSAATTTFSATARTSSRVAANSARTIATPGSSLDSGGNASTNAIAFSGSSCPINAHAASTV